MGPGAIGRAFCRIMLGFGCRVDAFDPQPDEECAGAGVEYVDLDVLLAESDVIALHCPLTCETHHLVDATALGRMEQGVMLVNTAEGHWWTPQGDDALHAVGPRA